MRTVGEHRDGVHPVVAAAFRALDDAGLAWVLLRGADDLAAPTGDVDVLVEGGSADRIDRALRRAGLLRMGVLGHRPHRFYLHWDPEARTWLTLDVVTEIRFGRFQQLRTPLAAGFLQRRRRVEGLWRPAAADEAWFLLLHLLLDKRRLAPARRAGAQEAAARAGLADPVAEFLDARLGNGSARAALAACARAGPRPFGSVAAALGRRWAAREPVRVAAAWLGTLAARGTDLPFPGHPRGLVVAVTGPGAGALARAVRGRYPGPRRVSRSRWAARLHRRVGRVVVLRRLDPGADVVLTARPGEDRTDEVFGAVWARLAPDADQRYADPGARRTSARPRR